MMTILYVPTSDEVIQGELLKAMLRKGLLVVVFGGRGTFSGSRVNF
jgi:hypothetical protein